MNIHQLSTLWEAFAAFEDAFYAEFPDSNDIFSVELHLDGGGRFWQEEVDSSITEFIKNILGKKPNKTLLFVFDSPEQAVDLLVRQLSAQMEKRSG